MKRSILFIQLILTLFALGCTSKEMPEDEMYDFYPVERMDLVQTIETNGSIEIENEISISSPVRGRLEKLYIEVGDKVKKNQKVGYMSSDTRIRMLEMAAHKGPDEYAYWKSQILPTYIFAPRDGTVIEIIDYPGDDVSKSIAKISAGEVIRTNVDEIDIHKISKGQTVEIQFEIDQEVTFEGTINKIDAVSKKVSKVNVYGIEVSLPSEQELADKNINPKIGMTVSVIIPVETIEDALAIELPAVNNQYQKKYKATLKGGKKVTAELGKPFGDYVHIKSGLDLGQEVRVPKFSIKNTNKKKSPLNFFK